MSSKHLVKKDAQRKQGACGGDQCPDIIVLLTATVYITAHTRHSAFRTAYIYTDTKLTLSEKTRSMWRRLMSRHHTPVINSCIHHSAFPTHILTLNSHYQSNQGECGGHHTHVINRCMHHSACPKQRFLDQLHINDTKITLSNY